MRNCDQMRSDVGYFTLVLSYRWLRAVRTVTSDCAR